MAELPSRADRRRVCTLAAPYYVRIDSRDLEHPRPAETAKSAESAKATLVEAALFAVLTCVELDVFSSSGSNVQIRVWESDNVGAELVFDSTTHAAQVGKVVSELLAGSADGGCRQGSTLEGYESDLVFLTETKAAAEGWAVD